jgi:D-alanyl-D-alanine carboxypeptidase/D-alanyl-D-alanine-endopeptidase (penicillin-binding protein 4)
MLISRMKCLVVGAMLIGAYGAASARADLAGTVQTVLQDKLLRKATVGIKVMRLGNSVGGGTVLYEHDSHIPLMPASNLKLVTTSAFLDHAGADFKFRTWLVMHDGNAVILGDGDPTLGDGELMRRVGWNVLTVYQSWAEQLKKRGITSVQDVVVDDSVFDQDFFNEHWPRDQAHKSYEAQVGGVNFNANCVDFYVKIGSPGQLVQYVLDPPTQYVTVQNTCVSGQQNAIWLSRQLGSNDIVLRGQTNASNTVPVSVTIDDPPMYAATVLAETLKANGVTVRGKVIRNRDARAEFEKGDTQGRKAWLPVAVHETPLPIVLARCNKDSMNLYAESLCKRLGHDLSHEPGSWKNGTGAVGAFLNELGIANTEFQLVDGCGLAREDHISAGALVGVLLHDYHAPYKQTFLNSLSVAGHDGTLSDRFRGTDLQGRVFGKSGYISTVSSLSGFLEGKNGQWYVFTILMNGVPPGANGSAKLLQERIVAAIEG